MELVREYSFKWIRTAYSEFAMLIVIILFLLSFQVRILLGLLLLKIGGMLFVVLLELVLNSSVLWESFVIPWIGLKSCQALV